MLDQRGWPSSKAERRRRNRGRSAARRTRRRGAATFPRKAPRARSRSARRGQNRIADGRIDHALRLCAPTVLAPPLGRPYRAAFASPPRRRGRRPAALARAAAPCTCAASGTAGRARACRWRRAGGRRVRRGAAAAGRVPARLPRRGRRVLLRFKFVVNGTRGGVSCRPTRRSPSTPTARARRTTSCARIRSRAPLAARRGDQQPRRRRGAAARRRRRAAPRRRRVGGAPAAAAAAAAARRRRCRRRSARRSRASRTPRRASAARRSATRRRRGARLLHRVHAPPAVRRTTGAPSRSRTTARSSASPATRAATC